MGCLARSIEHPNAVAGIRALPNPRVGKMIRELVEKIANDPVGMTKGFTHGVRMCDGMVMDPETSCYFQITYSHVEGSGVVSLLGVKTWKASGPH